MAITYVNTTHQILAHASVSMRIIIIIITQSKKKLGSPRLRLTFMSFNLCLDLWTGKCCSCYCCCEFVKFVKLTARFGDSEMNQLGVLTTVTSYIFRLGSNRDSNIYYDRCCCPCAFTVHWRSINFGGLSKCAHAFRVLVCARPFKFWLFETHINTCSFIYYSICDKMSVQLTKSWSHQLNHLINWNQQTNYIYISIVHHSTWESHIRFAHQFYRVRNTIGGPI